MKRGITLAGMLVASGLACAPCAASASEPPPLRPFETLLPWMMPQGRWEAAAAILYRDHASAPFFTDRPETRRDEWRVSLVDIAYGLGSGGEARVQFGAQSFEEEGGLRKTGIQDARISFSYQIPVRRIDTAVQLAVKLPNAPDERRLGTDETDLFLTAAVGRRGDRWGWACDIGLGILGSPLAAGVQDDVMRLGAAAWLTPGGAGPGSRVTLLGEIRAAAASRFGNNVRYARAGILLGRRIPVDLSVRRGLTPDSERWGAEAGVTLSRTSRSGSRRR